MTLSGLVDMHATVHPVLVNGEAITQEELSLTYQQLPDEYREQFSEQEVLEQLIDKVLLLQEADRRGIVVSSQEVDEFIDEQVAMFGISTQQLARTLEQAGMSLDEYRVAVREELVLREFVDTYIFSDLEDVSDEQQSAVAAARIEELMQQLREDASIVYSPEYQS